MRRFHFIVAAIIALATVGVAVGPADAFFKRDRAKRDFRHMDNNGDDRISRTEWNRRGNFKRLDANNDDSLSLDEVRALYHGQNERDYSWPPDGMPAPDTAIDPSVASDRVETSKLDRDVLCAISRDRGCSMDIAVARGLAETGTGPVFPAGAVCPGIDDYWAMNYSFKRNRTSYHGGIDLPVPWGTPVRAVAAGSVVAIYPADNSKRGNELVLRHAPEDTGLEIWTYSAYGHMDRQPDFEIGQRVKMGQILGPTGNSGISARGRRGGAQSSNRRPAIHLATFFSAERTFSEYNNVVIPADGYWLDPMAMFRQTPPFDTPSVIALPDAEKGVAVPVMFDDGTTHPASTKLVWPYTCRRE